MGELQVKDERGKKYVRVSARTTHLSPRKPSSTHKILLLRLHLRIRLPRPFNLDYGIPSKITRPPRRYNCPLCPSLKQDRLRARFRAVRKCADGRCAAVLESVEEGVETAVPQGGEEVLDVGTGKTGQGGEGEGGILR